MSLMTPERYSRIKELFHSALERAPDERPAFLAEACGGDAALLAKVEALIAADEQPGNFLDAPVYELAAEMLAAKPAASLAGQQLGHYQIISLLGSGGMGDVYLAKDTRLGRRVALKLLPDYLTDDETGVRRFKREARAASALNHPNLVTIYEIEQADGRYFIATEFVEGETLREHLRGGRLTLDEALDIAAQIAGALSQAHQAGIVHRDIKPENIMLNPQGRVKVLDFGLAKYTPPTDDGEAESTAAYTLPGTLMGTTAYMSPEQARGLVVDARTDIWSLGVVLYEMVAGRTPFNGQTSSDVLAAILEHEPEPLPNETLAPESLQRIIRRTVEKERERRYHSSKDLALDLEDLQRELHTGASHGVAPIKQATQPSPTPTPARGLSKNRITLLAAGLLLVSLAVVGIRTYRSSSSEPASGLVRPVAAPAVTAAERSLSYWMDVQKYRDGKPFRAPFRLGGEINFEKDYRVRLNLHNRQDGHLYILNEGPAASGQPSPFVILFPSPTANNGQSLLNAGGQVQVPERSWFRFDAEEGTEKIWLVWSAEDIPALEAVKEFANPRDRGLISKPELNNAVRDFLQAHQSARPLVERDEDTKEVVLKGTGDILTHLLRLEHH
jgi:serine/threonine protein kinase